MKKILAFVTLLLILVGFLPQDVDAMTDTGYFVVTAYYSPLPNQKHYLTGNYEAEIRLNGEGIKGASGKKVFSGMLAGPKTYNFGTKIYLEGLGIGEISDRGGAIVTAGNRGYSHDRIDVWMGYGDEGLQRAMYWGKRTVKGNITNINSEVTLNYFNIASPAWTTTGLKPQNNVFTYSLGIGSDIARVKKLQQFFSDLGIYTGEIDGIYNKQIIDIVYNFQIENEIVSSENDDGAGYWGNITKDKFKKAYLNGEFDVKKDEVLNNKDITDKQEIVINQVVNTEIDIFSKSLTTINEIKKLQEILSDLGFYSGDLTGKIVDITDSIYDFQLENNIVSSIGDVGAGTYGPKTRSYLKTRYDEYKIQLENNEKARLEAEKLKQEEEKRKQELEDKYKEIEKIALNKVEEKTKNISLVKVGDVSSNVRNLQLTLKELGYFNDKDTAIYGEKTKQAVVAFQLSNNLIDSENSQYAGVIGERTLGVIKESLKTKYLKEEVANNSELDLNLLLSYLPNIKI
ncbi:MAG: peptidoglycan-binding protein [Candidatus Gracilibacteria bacterium]|nr:peptidoglycan-binding protein [Candidatus Gracilibacteria bacterium]